MDHQQFALEKSNIERSLRESQQKNQSESCPGGSKTKGAESETFSGRVLSTPSQAERPKQFAEVTSCNETLLRQTTCA